MTDIIDELAQTNTQVSQLRNARPAARENAQLSFEALLEPAEAGEFSQAERYAVAAFVAGITQAGCPAEFYLDLLGDEDEELLAPVKEAIEAGQHRGPYAGGGIAHSKAWASAWARPSTSRTCWSSTRRTRIRRPSATWTPAGGGRPAWSAWRS